MKTKSATVSNRPPRRRASHRHGKGATRLAQRLAVCSTPAHDSHSHGRATTRAGALRRPAALAPRSAAATAPVAAAPVKAPEPATLVTTTARAGVAAEVRDHSASSDTLHLYLREIGQVKLLTPQEEVTLARRVQKGDEAAREHMIKANLRLVVKIARDYEGQGLPLLDLINEGNIGLMKGVERFDPTKGAKLSTYVALWIKQAIRRALSNQSKTIRLPDHVVDKMAHIRRAEVALRETLDRDPTDEEVADFMDLDLRRIRIYRQAGKAPLSLDAPLGSGDPEGDRVSEIVADTNAAAPFDRVVKETDLALIAEIFRGLNERERMILSMRFGLKDDNEKTLEEVGKHFGVTRERIRQIQDEALKKLRHRMEQKEALPHN